jgi:serine/threonine protein kinase/Flp pilus assembly protein TadD
MSSRSSQWLPRSDATESPVTGELEAMAAAWRRGERPRAEEFLARHPRLEDEDAIRLIYEEVCLRQERGEEAVSTEILRRFPRWESELALLFDCNRLLRTSPEAHFPEVGEDLGDFRLLAELGRGAHGRTYLASQRSLAGRPVVLKIAPLGHEEHLSLARLQHMHIVPLYFEHVLSDRNFRVLGMPYLGGTSLDRIDEALRDIRPDERTGRHLVEALGGLSRLLPGDHPPGGPFRRYLGQVPFDRAICWIAACLADALQYAHDRGLVHMDVKLSNVLVTADGQPMLLDFHLARGPIDPGAPVPDRLGGTRESMAPEQLEAMEAIRGGSAIATRIDGRADIYSLGLLLDEALGGDGGAGPGSSGQPLRLRNPRVSPGLSDIVRKCLARDAADRYPDAASLAIDLRRHLNDEPLRGVPNRSLRERWRKWRRRRPAALTRVLLQAAAVVAVLAAATATAFVSIRRSSLIDDALVEGRELAASRRFAEAARALVRGLRLAEGLSDGDPRKRAIVASLQAVKGEQAAATLHGLVDLLRFRYGITPPTPVEAESLSRRVEEVWESRGLLSRMGIDRSNPGLEQQIRSDFLDLATIAADLRIRGGPPGRRDAILGEVVMVLRDAEGQFGPSPALRRDLVCYARLLGRAELAALPIPTPRTAWEHFDLGRSYLRTGEHDLAEAEFRRSVELQPGEFWPNFFLGVCDYRLGRPQDAAASLSICVALSPGTAECYYNRAMAFQALDEPARAWADYTRALDLRPDFTEAALNRGILEYRRGRHAEAIRDFASALAKSPAPEARRLILYNMALAQLALREHAAAESSLKRAMDDGDARARDLYHRIRFKE